jgi:hypothetical protein
VTKKLIQQFRDAVYQSFLKRPDAVLDLIDALTVAGHVESPVTLSEQTPFRRKFSMVYDTLSHAVIDLDALLHSLLDYQPTESETIAGTKFTGWMQPRTKDRSRNLAGALFVEEPER